MRTIKQLLALLSLVFMLDASAASTDVVKAVASCGDLASVDISDVGGQGSKITKADTITRNGRQVCSVEGTMAPTIGFKITLPLDSWTQRYLQVGCGGLCGRVSTEAGAAEGCKPLKDEGFVVAGTDMGHSGMSSEFGNDPQKREDFAYRAEHLTAVLSKKLIKVFYGRPQSYAYFTGCSDGGREALMEAQRYPDDFDGIIAGAAALNFLTQNAVYHAWQAVSNTGADGKPVLIASRLSILHNAVLKQCGAVDGVIADPRSCKVDVAALQCKADDTSNCLTAAEVSTVRRLYDGPRDPVSGKRLTIGGPLPGSELAWQGVFVPNSKEAGIFSSMVSLQVLQNLAYPTNPPAGFKLSQVEFTEASFNKLRAMHPLYDATNPDLSAFAKAGRKLILWHGLSDQHISPLNTIAYHHALEQFMGQQQTAAFERMFLFPGMEHCGGGVGVTAIDLLTPMLEWVEHGKAPEEIIAHTAAPRKGPGSFGAPTDRPQAGAGSPPGGPQGGPPPGGMPPGGMPSGGMPPGGPMGEAPGAPAVAKVQQSRPVYAYPYLAVYNGSGDKNAAASYSRSQQPARYEIPDWIGADFFKP
ncbi:tannase/feruloyl esterase family alpha/beta hydrolase [Duganella sp. FT80W]|uniref:Tannase/feruloyl esterase family alpha/beta hydrolase n=1 Tax=Duganella guangzhouensis TaxID=2666084 RepID=A0A6I2KXF6_9BURK|nr:tannase/feruloyl esterase family alpha/beta hydrolase [Duganella guangzhouensis]MRW90210.1 tannase/feruloyl esterase family alpha/beta hydrolase [Duganella guangzhouensis]